MHSIPEAVADQWVCDRYETAAGVVVGFERKRDAVRFLHALGGRFGQFELAFASGQDPAHRFRQVRECGPPGTGAGPPGDVRTPGFHALLQDDRERTVRARTQARCGRSRTLKRIAEVLRRREHYDLHEVTRWLGRVVNGWLNYYALPTSARFLRSFTDIVKRIWLKALRRRA